MFTKLAPHEEDVGENVTFMARFIIVVLRKLCSVAAAAAPQRDRPARLANPHISSIEYAKILHACVFFFCSSIAAPRALQDCIVVQKCVTS